VSGIQGSQGKELLLLPLLLLTDIVKEARRFFEGDAVNILAGLVV
jgi:hypothetical protein